MAHDHTYNILPATPSAHQTLDEMDFERGIWYPALTGDLSRVHLMLQNGHCPNSLDKSGYTALHYSARCGYTTICAKLLEAGADVNASTRAGKSTPLHRAALAGQDETLELLLRYRADPTLRDEDGRTPLHRAVECGKSSTALLLFEACPQMANERDKFGKTPTQYASSNPNLHRIFPG